MIRIVPADGKRVPWAEGMTVASAEQPGFEPFLEAAGQSFWTPQRPASGRLPIPYHHIPPKVRGALAGIYGRLKRSKLKNHVPIWPLDLSMDYWFDWMHPAGPESPAIHDKTPVLLSHDLDTQEGVENCLRDFLPLEEKHGARSANYVVTGKPDFSLKHTEEIHDRGHEIGVHGFDHSNTTPFLDPGAIAERLDRCLTALKSLPVTGYRAPSLLRTPALLRGLEGRFRYDSSMPASGGLFPSPRQGCFTARPFRFGELWEIPISMPRDGSLRFLGFAPGEILEVWKTCAEQIHRSGGVVSLLTHCESIFSGNPDMLNIYEAFLEFIAHDSRFVWSSTGSVLETASEYPEHNCNVLRISNSGGVSRC